MTVLAVILGAAVGAPARYLLDRAVTRATGDGFPWGTLAVNLSGCLVIGVLLGAAVSGDLHALLVGGLCGAFTTYSTFAFETVSLHADGARLAALGNAVANVVGGTLATALGWWLAAG